MRPAFFCAYMRWSAIRSASATSLASARQLDRAVGAADLEALAALGQRARRRPTTSGSATSSPGVNSAQNSSPPMRNAVPRPRRKRGEAGAEADEQRVARRVAERVVVVLEAVEVEQHQHERLGGRRARQLALERARERAPVAEAGQRVGLRLLARRAQHRDVVAEGEHRARHHRHQRRGGEPDRDQVEVARGSRRRAARGRPRRSTAARTIRRSRSSARDRERAAARAARRRCRSGAARATSRCRTRRPACTCRSRCRRGRASRPARTTAMPASSSTQVRSSCQPVPASAPTITPSRIRSVSG